MVAITSLRKDVIFAAVRGLYTDLARHPERAYHVPTGRQACVLVGYADSRLAELPASAIESFAGVGYPFAANVIRRGDTVLDVGCGSGTDALIAASDTGSGGDVIALDMTVAMLEKLERCVAGIPAINLRALEGNAEQIPLPDASVDVATSNGVFNLVPDKHAAFAQLHRVLRPGGRVQIADIAVGRQLTAECASDPALWAECIVGATVIDEYVAMLEQAGFTRIEMLGQFDYFSASGSAATRSIAASFRACSFVLRAAKAPSGPLPPALPWPPRPLGAAAEQENGVKGERSREPAADLVLDAFDQTCGMVEPMMKRRMNTLVSGQVLEVRVDDPAARLGVPAWSRLTGHTLVATIEDDERRTRFFIRKR